MDAGATTASAAWEDDANTAWDLRYRAFVDTSGNPFVCDFSGEPNVVFADIETNWIFLDNDGDGDQWNVRMQDDGNYYFVSNSWTAETGSLDPDNWLITPMVNLYGVLRFSVEGMSGYSDHLMPYICIGEPNTIDDFVALGQEDIVMTSQRLEYIIDLSEYAGQQGRIAFRHYDSYDQTCVFLNDIFIGDPDAEIVKPEDWTYVNDLTDNNYIISDLMPETQYEVSVRARGAGSQTSQWVQPVLFTTVKQPDVEQPCDVNGDGRVTIKDVTDLINFLLSGDDTGININAADCNQNGEIKITDVTYLINYLLSGSR